MDFEFFERLTPDEAATFLTYYKGTESAAVQELVRDASEAGVTADFSLESVPDVFAYVVQQVDVEPSPADDSLPDWIRQSSSYPQGLYDFADHSRPIVVRLSYYLGESFVRSLKLHWGIGDEDTAVVHQPVVNGFRNRVQMSPLLVTENLLRATIEGESERVERAVETWKAMVA